MGITTYSCPGKSPVAVATCLLGPCALALLASLALSSCGANGPAIYGAQTYAVPTIAGNGEVGRHTAAGGAVDITSARSPDGRAMVDACIAIQQRWNDYLRSSGMVNTQAGWVNWWRMMQLTSVPDRCIDYATYGTPMSTGATGMGMGIGAGGLGSPTW